MTKVVVAGYDKMLAALVSGAKFSRHDVVGVLRHDRVKFSKFTLFFKDIFNPSHDLSFIKSHNIKDIKAQSVNSREFIEEVKRLQADIILVGSWSEKFGPEILLVPKFGVVNCHPSLLPRHRGANPYFWAIYSGDDRTGVTFHKMSEKFDAGDILMQASFDIEPNMTGGALKNKAAKVVEIMTRDLLRDLEADRIVPVQQDEKFATYDKYPFEGMDVVDFRESVQKTVDKVRGLRPWGWCYCNIENKVYKIKSLKPYEAHVKAGEAMPLEGEVLKKDLKAKSFVVMCPDGAVEIKVF